MFKNPNVGSCFHPNTQGNDNFTDGVCNYSHLHAWPCMKCGCTKYEPVKVTFTSILRAIASMPLYVTLVITGGDFNGLIGWWKVSRGGFRSMVRLK